MGKKKRAKVRIGMLVVAVSVVALFSASAFAQPPGLPFGNETTNETGLPPIPIPPTQPPENAPLPSPSVTATLPVSAPATPTAPPTAPTTPTVTVTAVTPKPQAETPGFSVSAVVTAVLGLGFVLVGLKRTGQRKKSK